MRIVIAGRGLGFWIASCFGACVTVIDVDPGACSRLADIDLRILQSNAADARLLIEAGIKQANIALAVIGNDEVNVIICITIVAHMELHRRLHESTTQTIGAS